LFALALAQVGRIEASENVWTNAAGNGLWDSISANWTDPPHWNNAVDDTAIFGSAGAGTVTLGENVTVSGMRFDAAGYTIASPGNGMQLQIPGRTDTTVETNADAVIGAQFYGTGELIKTGDGMLTLTGSSTLSGGVRINEGTLRIGNGGTTGSISGLVLNNAELVFDRSNSLTLNGPVTGSGHVTKLGAGSLAGTFFHTGGTTVSDGTLVLSLESSTRPDIAGDVVNDAVVAFQTVSGGTYSGNMSGAGLLSKQLNGTLVLSGTNTYSGGTRVFTGTLQLGSGGTTGSVAGDVIVDTGSALAFSHSDNTNFGGVISGGGRLNKLSANTLALTGANTYAGGTTISGGTLSIGDGGTTGSIAEDVTNNATLAFNRSDDSSFAGIISGGGNVVKQGAGMLTLTGANKYTGGTTISGGMLSIGNGGTTGSVSGYVANSGTVVFNRSNDFTFSGTVAGSGAVVKQGSGRMTLYGALNHTGGTTVSAGILQIGDSTQAGQLAGDVLNNSVVSIVSRPGEERTFAGNLSGSGSLQVSGTGGKIVLTGNNTHTGGTLIATSMLQVGNGGTTGSIQGSISSGGILAFNRSDSLTYSGNLSGNGTLQKLGGGTLTFTGSKSGSGATTIFDGTLALGDGQSSGNFSGAIINNSKLALNPAGNSVLAGVISGPGSVTKLGPGTVSLTGNNTYTGLTTVTAGTLSIGNGASTGGVAGDIVTEGTVSFNRSDGAGVYGGTITGSGAVTKLGAGTYTITGSLRQTGGTTVSAGTLQIGLATTPGGRVDGDIVNNGAVLFGHNENISYAHVISGTGWLHKWGAGRLTLTGENTYAGSTSISGGTLQIGNGGASGSVASNIATLNSSSGVEFNRAGDLVVPNVISGSGYVRNLGTGRLTLTGDSSFSGSLYVNQGKLSIGAGGTSGSIAARIINDTEVEFNRSDDSTFTGSVSGKGQVIKRGAGALSLTGSFGHTGGTTVGAGTLRLSTGSSLTGNVLNNAAIEYVGAAGQQPLVLAANISGPGTVAKTTFTSQLAITGTNTYTGGTKAYGGVLQIGNGGTVGSIVGDVDTGAIGLGIGTIAFNRSDDFTFPGVVSGAGNLRKAGGNTLHLTAAHTYTGSTEIIAGTLVLDGSASISGSANIETSVGATLDVSQMSGGLNYEAGRFALASGQSLSGVGAVVGDVGVRAGASIAPGLNTAQFANAGTLNVTGSADFLPGSTLDILAGALFKADRLTATGAVTFAGTAENPFTINVTKRTSGFIAEPRAFVIASGASIGSSGLDAPLSLIVGASGVAEATNGDHIRLAVSGFEENSMFTVLRAGNEVRLEYVSPVAADFDDNGVVDSGDLARWTANTGSNAAVTNESGDADADGDVDGTDFLAWQRQLGLSRSASAGPVPEPAAGALGLLAIAAAMAWCNRRQ
jgi:autotransporter-associated beta strand protein